MSTYTPEIISILIVENNQLVAKDLTENLTIMGYKLVGNAASGLSAIEMAVNLNPNIILMDIELDGEMDGIEAASLISKKMDSAIIYLSAYADEAILRRAKLTTPYGYLLKPFEVRELQTTIEMAHYKNRLETKIKESERWLFTTLQSIADAVIATDNNGKIIFLNSAAEKLTLLKKEALVGKKADDAIFIKNGNSLTNVISSLLSSIGDINNYPHGEFAIIAASGEEIPVLFDASPIHEVGKNISGLVIVMRDILEKKKSEKKILSNERRLAALVDSAMDAVVTADHLQNIIIFNAAAEKIFRCTADEAIGKKLNSFFPERFKEIHDEHIKLFSGGDKNISRPLTNLYALRSNGDEFPIEASISQFAIDEETYITVILRDITEKKIAEQKIRMLSSAVEQSSANIMITDTECKIVYVNPKFEKITGYNLNDVVGHKLDFLEADKDNPHYTTELWDTIRSGQEWCGEFKNQRKDGIIYWEEALISPVKDSSGNITNFLSVNEDITKRKQQEEHLIRAKENAEQANKLKSEFIAQISHEIRTPLNSILSFTGLIREEIEDKIPPELAASFKIIDTSANRLIRTIELLLNLSKIQSGNFEVKIEPIDLHADILDDIILEFYSKAKVKGLEIVYVNECPKPTILADRYTLGQIFYNLIENAIKYTNRGSIKIELIEKDDKVVVSIIDTGIGITKEYLPSLFTPFSQEEFGYTRRYEGTGLGLALVQKYVEIINAQITVESEKGKGSKFTIFFNRLATH
ncbi:MAG: PAS domain S-box protein [Ignavibacteriaceae bacterium]|nr:PAS domain S-box protein [Ignavibacteriaceae bacterium]